MRPHPRTLIDRLAPMLALAVAVAACGAETQPTPDGADAGADSSAVQSTAEDEERGSSDEPDEQAEDADQHGDGSTETKEHLVAEDSDATETDHGDARLIEIEMVEFAYEPSSIEIDAGETVILRFSNLGQVAHEAMIGDAHMQEEFAASDDHGDHGGGHHGDLMAVTVPPGETEDLTVEIDEPGEIYIGCHLPGHFDAGMQATLTAAA